jgi:hypothetical protein
VNTTASADTGSQTLEAFSVSEIDTKTHASAIVKTLAIVLPLLSFVAHNWMMILAMVVGANVHGVEIARMAGSLVGVFLSPLIIMLLFQIGKRFRNARSRWTIFMNAGIFFLVVSIFSAIGKLAP